MELVTSTDSKPSPKFTYKRSRSESIARAGSIVVAVLVALALLTLAATDVDYISHDAEASTERSEAKTIHGQAAFFMRSNGFTPTLDNLFERDERGRAYIESGGREDPWGTPYVIRETDDDKIEALSAGPDTIEDTEDDIVFPEREENG